MEKLLEKISKYDINDAYKIEESDKQFIALKNLYFKLKNKDFLIYLTIINSIVCYQLSSKGENYWEEFSDYFSTIHIEKPTKELIIFIKQSLGNKRLLNTKEKRILKIESFINTLNKEKIEYYYNNQEQLLEDLCKVMNQKNTAKTMVFTLKMFNYACRVYFKKRIKAPESIFIPIDSRLTKLYEIYNTDDKIKINNFYKTLSLKTGIPLLHLDAVLWVNYDYLITN